MPAFASEQFRATSANSKRVLNALTVTGFTLDYLRGMTGALAPA